MECRIGEEDEGLIQRSCHVTIVTQLMSFQRERERERERELVPSQSILLLLLGMHVAGRLLCLCIRLLTNTRKKKRRMKANYILFWCFFFREINREVYLSAISPKSKYSREWGEMVSNRKYGTGFTLHVGLLTRQIYTQKCVGLRIRYCTYLLILALSVTVNAGTVKL